MTPVSERSPDALVGARLGGKYLVARLLGEGGMGAVYEATNTNTGRRVAIKTLHAHLLGHESVRQRFLQEARAATQIEHPNVIDVLDLEVDAALGIPFIVQELLSGENLAERLAAAPGRRLTPATALRVAEPVMRALVAAHALGIVHRDLKPENIFLARDRSGAEVPKVIDFGIAKVLADTGSATGTQAGLMLGTPAYMSPEQAMGCVEEVDALSDVWAVGVVLYEMLSGRLPYEAANAAQTLGMIQYRDPIPLAQRDPSLPPALVAVIARALTRHRAERHATMQAFLDALRRAAAATLDAPPEPPTRASAPPVDPPIAPPAATLDAAVVSRGSLGSGPPSTPLPVEPASRRRVWGFLALGLLGAASAVVGASLGGSPRTAATPRALPAAPVRAIAQVTPAPPRRAAPPPAPPTPAPVALPAPVAPPPPASAMASRVVPPPRPTHSATARGLDPVTRTRPRAVAPSRSTAGRGLDPEREWRP